MNGGRVDINFQMQIGLLIQLTTEAATLPAPSNSSCCSRSTAISKGLETLVRFGSPLLPGGLHCMSAGGPSGMMSRKGRAWRHQC